MIRPLFIVGNKRSGTSQLVRVLNLHPRVFVSHESDIAWLLYQFHAGQPYQAHQWDSARGMQVTLEIAADQLKRTASPRENFLSVQHAVMEKGNPWLPARQKPDLLWVGDKKPMQHTDPVLLKFLHTHFPDAHFLHIIRHPCEVVASSNRFNQTPDGDFWQGLSSAQKLSRWSYHEAQVLQLQQALPGRVHSLRYEDFCRETEKELTAVFRFLQLDPDPLALQEAARQTRQPDRPIEAMDYDAETVRIAALYKYDLPAKKTWLHQLLPASRRGR